MAGWWRGLTLLLLVLCSVSLAAASDVDGLQGLNQDFSSRKLLQVATPPVPAATPPVPVATPPVPVATPPVPVAAPPVKVAAPPVRATSPSTQTLVRQYLMWVGIGAFLLVLLSVAIFCLCRKFGQQKVRGAQRLPPLPRYH